MGKKILIVGPGRTGKTSFKNYFFNGILLNEGSTPKTGNHKTKKGKIITSNSGSFEIDIKSITDSPGQIGPIIHANSVEDYRPDYLFVFMSCKPDELKESTKWFQNFCDFVYTKFRDDPGLANNLTSIFIILNKVDLIEGNNEEEKRNKLNSIKEEVDSIAKKELNHVYYRAGDELKIPIILPAICVKHSDALILLEEIINTLASKN